MPTLPDIEPNSFTAGETVQWTRNFSGFDSLLWSLKYAFHAPGKPLITVPAEADGSGFTVTIEAETSAGYAPGAYTLAAFVERDTERHVLRRVAIDILPSPLAALGSTHATRMLALIQAALEGRIPNGLESTEIDGQRIDRTPVEILEGLETKYRVRVASEEAASGALLGRRPRRTLAFRFVRP